MLSLFSSKSQHDPIPHFFRTLATCPPSCPVNQCLIDCECRPQNECPKDLTLVLMIVFGIATLIILVLLVVYLCTRERKGNRLANRAIQGRPANAHPVDENHLAPVNMPILGNTQQNLYVAANPQGIAPNPNQFNTSPAQYLNLKLIVNTSPDANANPQVHLQPQPQPQPQPPSQFAVNPPANLDASSFGLVNNNNRTEIAMEESALNKSAFKDLSQIHEDPDASNSHMKAGTEPNDISILNNKATREVGKEEFQREKSIPNKSILNELSQMIEENDASNVQAQAAEAHHNSIIQNKLQTEDAKDDSRQEKSFNKSATKELSHTKESNVIIHKTTLNILDKFEIAESKNE